MMACNDISLANDALERWNKENSRIRGSRKIGARMYFVRLQISHLVESMKIVDDIKKDESLVSLLRRCDAKTQASFAVIEDCLPGGKKRARFEQMAGQIRSNLCFHYDQSGKLIGRAIVDRATRHSNMASSVTRASTGHLWHFALADEMLDQIVVRQIWRIPLSSNVKAEAEAHAEWIREIGLAFVDFSGEFIWRYFER
jgi:hypothetical protein